jgi:hypothetical protein
VDSVEEAARALAVREKTPRDFGAGSWRSGERDPALFEWLNEWASRAVANAVIWMALGPRMNGDITMPSAFAVTQYLTTLNGDTRQLAETYVRRTPRQIQTPYRKEIESHFGWTPTDASLKKPRSAGLFRVDVLR